MEPSTPLRTPLKVVLGVAVPNVKFLPPKTTELLATPERSPMVVVEAEMALISNTAVALLTLTAPEGAKLPEPERATVPSLMVVPPV
jgi:hypothetical protein